MSLGLFVVGTSDKQVIPILISKLGYKGGIHCRIAEQGDAHDVDTMLQHIRFLRLTQPTITKIIVCIDSECTDIQETLGRARRTEEQLSNTTTRPPVKYVVVDHSLEGWLLQDLDAVRSVLGTRSRLSVPANPENECRPADLLRQLFQRHSKNTYKKTVHNERIARKIDIELLKSKSPTFAYFAEAL